MMSRSFRILVVDDDVDNALSLAELLEMEGHSVRVVHSGEEAIRAAVMEDFNLSFMDVVLPGLNGVESFIAIRRVRPQARVYMMTAYSVEQLLTQALDGGALGVLEKPFDPDALLKLTNEVGPSGLVLAPPSHNHARSHVNVGHFIRETLQQSGMRCRHVTDPVSLPNRLSSNEVLLLDVPAPMLEGVEILKQAQAAGHRAQTVLVPHPRAPQALTQMPLNDVAVTGILNKPFDPLTLINKLTQLAA
jgi:two-component system, NtrC family, response regulator HydG